MRFLVRCILCLAVVDSSFAGNLPTDVKASFNGKGWFCWQLVSVTERTRSQGGNDNSVQAKRWVRPKSGDSGKSAKESRKTKAGEKPPLQAGYGDLRDTLSKLRKMGRKRRLEEYAFNPKKGTSYTEDFPDDTAGRLFLDKSRNLIVKVAIENKENLSHGLVTLHKLQYVWGFGRSKEGFPVLKRIIRSFDGTAFYFKSFHGTVSTEFVNPVFAKKLHCK